MFPKVNNAEPIFIYFSGTYIVAVHWGIGFSSKSFGTLYMKKSMPFVCKKVDILDAGYNHASRLDYVVKQYT